ncbi:hypothetical protein GCM10022393_38180 [Aquimarina addita]|uniref:Matrixin n=1 Tax=Aquimarina addita TaxID=870485 RepID=A0ABP6UV00_9FLAO
MKVIFTTSELLNKIKHTFNLFFPLGVTKLSYLLKNKLLMSFKVLFVLFTLISCVSEEEEDFNLDLEMVFVDNPAQKVIIDITYVVPSDRPNKSMYNVDEQDFVKSLNGKFFHRIDIGFELGQINTMVNDELFDLRDNRDVESETFLSETENSYKKDRLTIFIIKRSNTIAIAGIGKNQRALITDEFLFTSTAPHEIGHALGLFHYPEEGNIMSLVRPYLRKDFTGTQAQRMKTMISDVIKAN